MVKKASKYLVILSIILSSCLMPFHIYAEEINAKQFNTNSIIGFNVQSEMVGVSVSYYWINHITVTFDDYYICGPVSYTLRYKTNGVNATYQTESGKFGVNGTSVEIIVMTDDGYILPTSVSFTSFNYSGTAYTQVDFLQEFPIESFPIQAYNLANNPLVGIDNTFSYKFNTFLLKTNSGMYQYYGYKNYEYIWVFWSDKNIYTDTINDYVNLGTNVNLVSCQVLYRFHYEGHSTSLVKVTVMPTTTGGKTMTYINSNDAIYMPVYFNISTNKNISTDFALQFGLTNRLLDDLDYLQSIQPTNESESSSESLTDSNEDLADSQAELFGYESDFSDDMNSSLNNIDTSFSLNALGSKYVQSSNWVRVQFNRITGDTPFGSVLSFSLLLGLALLIVGKVFK